MTINVLKSICIKGNILHILPFENANLQNGALTGDFGLSYSISDDMLLKCNLSSAFRAPNIDDVGIDLYWLREAEVKHARVAMLAVAGTLQVEFFGPAPGCEMADAPNQMDAFWQLWNAHPQYIVASLIFIMFAEGSFLNGQYTVFGQVRSGMEFVDNITKGAGQNGTSFTGEPDTMVSVKIAADG